MSPEQPQQGPGSIKVERTQTGVRIEKRILKVLKALAEYLDISLGDLLEGIVLLAFEGKEPLSERLLGKIDEIKKVYELELTSEHAHKAHGPFLPIIWRFALAQGKSCLSRTGRTKPTGVPGNPSDAWWSTPRGARPDRRRA